MGQFFTLCEEHQRTQLVPENRILKAGPATAGTCSECKRVFYRKVNPGSKKPPIRHNSGWLRNL